MKTQAANSHESPSVRTPHEEMLRKRRRHLIIPIAALAISGAIVGGIKGVEALNEPRLVGTTQIDLSPNPKGDIDTIERAVDTITDSSKVGGITYEGQTIARELKDETDGSSAVTVSVYENNWPGAMKSTWVEASPTEPQEK